MSAAASLTDIMYELERAFEAEQPGTNVVLTTGGSSTLARQILNGAPADVFVSADSRQLDVLAEAGLVAESFPLLGNELVLVAHSETNLNTTLSLEELIKTTSGRIAVGDAAVPAGEYARSFLSRAGLTDNTAARLVSLTHVRHVLATVQAGNAELGFVYATDVAVARGSVRILHRIPESRTGPIVYPVALLRHDGAASARAREFTTWLRGAAASEILRSAGFRILAADTR